MSKERTNENKAVDNYNWCSVTVGDQTLTINDSNLTTMEKERQLRGVARGRVTKILNEIKPLLADKEVDVSVLKLNFKKLEKAENYLAA